MRYAMIRDGIVTNVIELAPENAGEFPDAVPVGEVAAGIGDSYTDGTFLRDGVRLLTPLEAAQATIVDLAAQVIDLQMALAEAEVGA